jgi:hypothetical protein
MTCESADDSSELTTTTYLTTCSSAFFAVYPNDFFSPSHLVTFVIFYLLNFTPYIRNDLRPTAATLEHRVPLSSFINNLPHLEVSFVTIPSLS